jgi:very-short-patch-repair endonuclease
MFDRYPVIKIPEPIATAKPRRIYQPKSPLGTAGLRQQQKPFPHPARSVCLPRQTENWGWFAIVLGIVLFGVGVVAAGWLIPYSGILLCLGIATVTAQDLSCTNPFRQGRSVATLQPNRVDRYITIPPNWEVILMDKLMAYETATPSAQVGVSEAYFKKYLKKYFAQILHPSYQFKINDEYAYSSDFTLILPNGIRSIVEIDEPYHGTDDRPHHCTDDGKDDLRDEFFLQGNWMIIRFSEFQICAYPVECCKVIAQTINRVSHQQIIDLALFDSVKDLASDPRWNRARSRKMAAADYRISYLEKYGVYRNKGSKNPMRRTN